MSIVVGIIGLQFGDEGKGKIVDLISSFFDYVVRYQGGDNAGHTIYYKNQKCVVRSIPSGIFNTTGIIAPGTVVNPFLLIEEMEQIEKLTGESLKGKLFISTQANVICDFHIEWDRLCEKLRDRSKIGSTLRGIGPAYADKSARIGIKIQDLFDSKSLKERLSMNLKLKNPIFKTYGFKTYNEDELIKDFKKITKKLSEYLIDYYSFGVDNIRRRKSFLLEGSQGVLLDNDLGTYPFVTSSNIVSSIIHGGYMPYKSLTSLIGVVKVYTTRVGEGPLITELTPSEKEKEDLIREKGQEYGSNTLRPRRIGWMDLNALKYSIKIGGIKELVLTMVDVFNHIDTFKVCIAYVNSKGDTIVTEGTPATWNSSDRLIPIYKEFPAWKDDYSKVKKFEDFSKELRTFVVFLERALKIPVSIISFGKNREDSIIKKESKYLKIK